MNVISSGFYSLGYVGYRIYQFQYNGEQETQLSLTNRATRLEVS